MEMVEIVYPTLDQYATRVTMLAEKYGVSNWLELKSEDISELDERFEFSFIQHSLWDKLIIREFANELDDPPGYDRNISQAEPGTSPGSTFLGVVLDGQRICRAY